MLERRVSALLAEHLQHFIKNMNEEQLRVSLWSGELVLHNLALRPDILDQIMMLLFRAEQTVKAESFTESAAAKALLLPFTVVVGVIKTLRVVVPWSSLDRDSFKVIVEGVEIVLGPLRDRPYSEDEEVNRAAAIKKKQCDMFERARQSTSVDQQEGIGLGAAADLQQRASAQRSSGVTSPRRTDEDAELEKEMRGASATGSSPTPAAKQQQQQQQQQQSYSDKIVASIIRNVHVLLRDINISYRFDYEGLDASFAAALSLHIGELSYSTKDSDWQGKPPQASQQMVNTAGNAILPRFISVKDFSMVLQNKRKGRYAPWPAASSTSPGSIGGGSASPEWTNQLTLVERCDFSVFFKPAEDAEPTPPPAAIGEQRPGGSAITATPSQQQQQQQRPQDHVLEVQFPAIQLNASLDTVQMLADMGKCLGQSLDCTAYRRHLHLLRIGESTESPMRQNGGTGAAGGQQQQARARWRFCFASLRSLLAEQRRDVSWAGIRAFCHVRRTYVGLYKRHHRVAWMPPLAADETVQLDGLERRLRIEQLVFLRCIAYAELTVDQSANMTQRALLGQQQQQMQQQQASQRTGWMRWLGYGSKPSIVPAVSSVVLLSATTTKFSVQEQKSLFVSSFAAEWLTASQFLQSKHKIQQLPAQSERRQGFQITADVDLITLRVIPSHSSGFRPASADRSPLLRRVKRLLQSISSEFVLSLQSLGANVCVVSSMEEEEHHHSVLLEVGRASAAFRSNHGQCSVPVIGMRDTADSDTATSPWVSVGFDSRRVNVLMSNCTVLLPLQHEIVWWITLVTETLGSLQDVPPLLASSSSISAAAAAAAPRAVDVPQPASISPPSAAPAAPAVWIPLHLVVVNSCVGLPFADASLGGFGALVERGAVSLPSPDAIAVDISACDVHMWTTDRIHRACQISSLAVEVALPPHTGHSDVRVTAAEPLQITLDPSMLAMLADRLLRPCATQRRNAFDFAVASNVTALHRQQQQQQFNQGQSLLVCELMGGHPCNTPYAVSSMEEERTIVAAVFAAQSVLSSSENPAAPASLPRGSTAAAAAAAAPSMNLRVDLQQGAVLTVLPIQTAGNSAASIGNTCVVVLGSFEDTADAPVGGPVAPLPCAVSVVSAGGKSTVSVAINEIRILAAKDPTAAQSDEGEEQQLPAPPLVCIANAAVRVESVPAPNHTNIDVDFTKVSASIAPPVVAAIETILGAVATISPKAAVVSSSGAAASETQTIRVAVSDVCLRLVSTNPYTKHTEPLACVHLAALRVTVDERSDAREVHVMAALAALQRVDRDGQCFDVMLPHASKEPALLKVAVTKPVVASSPSSSGAAPSTTAFSTFVSVQLSNIALVFYMGFFMRLSEFSTEPVLDRLILAAELESSIAGFSAATSVFPDPAAASAAAKLPPPSPPLTSVEVSVANVEVYAAVHAYKQVVPTDTSSYVLLQIPHVNVKNSINATLDGFAFVATRVVVDAVLLRAPQRPPATIVKNVQVLVSVGVLCVAEGDSYALKQGETLLDKTVRVQLGEHQPQESHEAHHQPQPCAVELALKPGQLMQLLSIVAFNVLDPVAQAQELHDAGFVPPKLTARILMLTIPSVRLLLLDDDDDIATSFEVVLAGGLQVYRAIGGSVWSYAPLQSVRLQGLSVVDRSPMVPVFDRAVPKAHQKARLLPRQPTPLLSVSAIDVIINAEKDADHNVTPASSTIALNIGDVRITLLPQSFFRLRDMIATDASTPCLAIINSPVPLHPDAVPSMPTIIVLHVSVSVARVKADLVEAWGDHVASLTAAGLLVEVRQQLSDAQRVDISLRHVALVQRVTDPALQTILSSHSQHRSGAAADDDGAAASAECPLKISVSVVPSERSADRLTVSLSPTASRPASSFTTFVDIALQGIDVVLVPHALLRILALVGEDLVPMSLLPLSPEERRKVAASPSFEATSLVVQAVGLRIRVPCDCTGKEAAVFDTYPSWILSVPSLEVSNEVSVAPVETSPPLPSLSAPSQLFCWVETIRIRLSPVEVKLLAGSTVSHLLSLDAAVVQVDRPVPRAAFTATVARHSSSSIAAMTNVYQIIPPTDLRVGNRFGAAFLMNVHITLKLAPQSPVLLTPFHIRHIVKTLGMTKLIEPTPYYRTDDATMNVEVGVRVEHLQVALCNEDHHGTRHVILTLTLRDALRVATLQPFDRTAPAKTSVLIDGSIVVSDFRGNTVLHRVMEPPQEYTSALAAAVVHPPAVHLSIVDTPPAASSTPAGAAAAGPSTQLELCLRDLRAHVNDNAVDVAVRVQDFVKHLEEATPAGPAPASDAAASGNSCAAAPPNSTGTLLVVLQRTRLYVTDTAVVFIAQASVGLPLNSPESGSRRHAGGGGESQHTQQQTSMVQIMLSDISLSRPSASSSLSFFTLASADVKIGVGSIYVKAQRPHLINHDTYFFLHLLQAVEELQQYIAAHTKLSKQSEESFKHTLVVTMVDLNFSLVRNKNTAAATNAAAAAVLVASPPPRLTVSYPAVVLKVTDTTSSQDISIEAEDGAMVFANAQLMIALPPLCKGLAFTLRHSVNEKSATTKLTLGRVTISVPIGIVQQTCTEIVAHALIPLIRFAKRGGGRSGEASGGGSHAAQLSDASTHAMAHHRATSLEVHAPQISIHTVDTMHARASFQPTAPLHHRSGGTAAAGSGGGGSAGGLLPSMDTVLFGLDIHQISFEHKFNGGDGGEAVVLKVFNISSVVNPSIQHDLLSTDGGQADGPAILLRKDVVVAPTAATGGAHHLPAATDASTTAAEGHSGVQHQQQQQTPEKRTSVVAKVRILKATVSPLLLKLVNDNILAHIAVAVRNSREHHNQVSLASPHRLSSAASSEGGGGGGGGGGLPSGIDVSQDYTVKGDLVLGGGNGGSWLHFKKLPMDAGKPVENVITFEGVNHATIYISMFDAFGYAGGPLTAFPIVVDEGLSVYCRNVRFVLQGSGSVLHDFILIGPRSFFCLIDPQLVIKPLAAISSSSHYPPLLPNAASGAASAAAATAGGAGRGPMQHHTGISAPEVPRRETLELSTFDVTVAVNLSLWSAHQKITVSTAIDGTYRILHSHAVGASAAARGSALPQVVDEGGDISLIDLTVVCDSGNITTEPTGLIVHIRHHRSKDMGGASWASRQKVVGSTTIGHCIVPNTRLSISLGHAKLLLDVVTAIQRGSKHISDIDESPSLTAAKDDLLFMGSTPKKPFQSSFTGSDGYQAAAAEQQQQQQQKISASSSSSHASSSSTSSATGVLLQVGITAPLVEIVLTNDFFLPIAVLSLSNTAVQVEAERGLNSLAIAACFTVQCCDFPAKDAQDPRQLLELSPELAVDFNRFKNDGLALAATVAVPDITLTAPIVTLLTALSYEFSKQNTGSYSFRNLTGVYLTLFSPDGNANNALLYCVVPPGETVKADIFRYDQTVFRIVEGTPDEVGGKNLAAVGSEIDLSRVSSASAVVIHLDHQQCNVGVTDIMLRLNERERLVELTSCVTFHNDLSTSRVTLYHDGSETVIAPLSAAALPLQALQHAFDIGVGACTKVVPNPVTIPPSPSLETLLGGFLIATSEPLPAATTATAEVEFPVLLDSGDAGHAAVSRSLSLLLRRTPITAEKYAYEVRLRAQIRLFNETGVAIHVAIAPTKDALLGLTVQQPGAMSVQRGGRRSNSPVMLSADASTLASPGGGSAAPFQSQMTLVEHRCGFDAVNLPSGADDGPFLVFHVVLTNRATLRSEAPVAMKSARFGVTAASVTAVAVLDGDGKRTFFRLEFTGDRYILRSGIVLTNNLPLVLYTMSGDKSGAPLAGQGSGAGLPPHGAGRLPVGFPSAKAAVDLTSALPLRVRTRDGSQPSGPFAGGVPTLSTMLSCSEGHLVHIFCARRRLTLAAPTPEVDMEPLWHIRNDHPTLTMCLRRVGLDNSDVLVPPATTVPLVTFAASTASDPQIQVAFQISGSAMFEWSQVIPLASLAGSSSAPIVVKHNFAHPDVRHLPIPMMTALRAPDIPERFCCLSLTMNRVGHAMTLHINVSNNFLPIVIENRSNESISFQQAGQREIYTVRPREDAPFAWSTFSVDSRRVTLHLVDGKQKKHTIVLDVFKESASTEVRKVADRLFLNCSHDVARRRIFISIVQDRHLESSFIQQSTLVVNVEVFIRRCALYVAGPCVATVHRHQRNPVVDALVAAGDDVSALGHAEAERARDVVRTHLLAGRGKEMDLVLIVIDHLSAKVTSNGQYHLASASLGAIKVHDCSLPSPVHPVVLSCDGGGQPGSRSAIEFRTHVLSPQIVGEKNVWAFKAVQLSVSTIDVRLCDSLLYVLQEAVLCVQHVMPQAALPAIDAAASPVASSSSARRGGTTSPTAPSEHATMTTTTTTQALSVACHVEKLWISSIPLVLTLTRRSDGLYNPFAVIPLGSLLIQSIEAAPLTLGEVVAVDVLKSALTISDALAQLVVPTYRTHVVLQLYKIIGSLEMLGNPVMFASNVSAGLRDFVVQTIHLHPVHGVSSLVSAATSGMLHSVALLSHIGGRTVATLSLDGEWLSQREAEQPEAARSKRRGVLTGLTAGIAGGITGVVMRPVHGARHSGFFGFCSGVATGILGVVGRPLAGTLDGIGNTAESAAVALRPRQPLQDAAAADSDAASGGITPQALVPWSRNFDPRSPLTSLAQLALSGIVLAALPGGGSRLPSPKQAAAVAATLHTDVSFCSRAAYAAQRQHCRGDMRRLMDTLGAHNVARYSPWIDFAAHATPQEFYDGLHIAVEKEFADQLLRMLERRHHPQSSGAAAAAAKKEKKPRQIPSSANFTADDAGNGAATARDDHTSARGDADQQDAAVASSAHALRQQQLLVVERIHNIKYSLGTRDLLKYVTMHQFVQFCSLTEIKNCFSLEELQNRIGPCLLDVTRESAASLFNE